MNSWLSLFSESGILTDVAILKDKDLSIFCIVISDLECKVNNNISSSSLALILTRIYLVLVFFWVTSISTYCYNVFSKPNIVSTSFSHVIFFVPKVRVTYSTWVDYNIIIAYLLEYKLTNPLFSINIKQTIDFLIA